jgi:hypothetical protein
MLEEVEFLTEFHLVIMKMDMLEIVLLVMNQLEIILIVTLREIIMNVN